MKRHSKVQLLTMNIVNKEKEKSDNITGVFLLQIIESIRRQTSTTTYPNSVLTAQWSQKSCKFNELSWSTQ